MTSRRNFIKYSLSAGAGLYLVGRVDPAALLAPPPARRGGDRPCCQRVWRQSRRQLDPRRSRSTSTPLLIPPVMPKAGDIKQKGGKNVDYYEISVRQFAQQILPAGLPPTTVWGYGAVTSASKKGLLVHNAPSLTIEAKWNTPVRVKWINELMDANGNYLPHLLPVDPTLHWANPPGGTMGRDTRPTFDSHAWPLHRPGADRHPRPRRGRRRRRERRLRRGLVPAGGRTTSRRAMPPRAPGTTSSRTRPRPSFGADAGDPGTPSSSTRTPSAPRPSGTTTTRWA